MNRETLLHVGYIARKYSFKGEVLARFEEDYLSEFKIKDIYIEIKGDLVPFSILKMLPHTKGLQRLKIDTIDAEEQALSLVRCNVYISKALLPQKRGKDFYLHELIGFTVEDSLHGTIGKITRIDQAHIQPLMVIRQDANAKEVLIPLVDAFIVDLDRPSCVVKVKTPEGLIDLYR